jgi:hypothetical protein
VRDLFFHLQNGILPPVFSQQLIAGWPIDLDKKEEGRSDILVDLTTRNSFQQVGEAGGDRMT